MDEKAQRFSEECGPYAGMVYRHCLHMLSRPEEAEDAAQETFLRALSHAEQLMDMDRPACRAWLYRTARNLFVDAMRRTAREAAALPELEPEPETPDPDFAEAEARRLLELLPPAEQELFRKRYLEGYTAAELGKMYGLPPATVRTRLAKARRYLSQLLMEE